MAPSLLRLKDLGARLGCDVVVGPQSGLHRDVAPGSHVMGSPQQAKRGFQRSLAAPVRLSDLLARVRASERRLGLGASSEEAPRS